MSTLLDVIAVLAHCNHHAVLYGGFGCTLAWGGLLALRERRFDEARERLVHGLLYVLLSLV